VLRANLYDAEGKAVFDQALEQDAVPVLNREIRSNILNARNTSNAEPAVLAGSMPK
jgi:hypothetical protein